MFFSFILLLYLLLYLIFFTCYLLNSGIIHKFKGFLKQRIIYSKCYESIFELKF